MSPPTRRAEVGKSATSVGVRSTLRINTMGFAEACRTHDCEERGAGEGAILAKINVSSNAEVGLVASTTGEAR